MSFTAIERRLRKRGMKVQSFPIFPTKLGCRVRPEIERAMKRLSRCMNCSYIYSLKGYRHDTLLGRRPLIFKCCSGWMVECRDCGVREVVRTKAIEPAVERWNAVMAKNPRPFRVAVRESDPMLDDDIPF